MNIPDNINLENVPPEIIGIKNKKHPKCKGWYKYEWGMMDGPDWGCNYNTIIECDECKYNSNRSGMKDPEAKCNQIK